MKRITLIALLIALGLTALGLAACGGGGELPFTAAAPGLTLDEALALEPELGEADAEKQDWSCPREFAGCPGTLFFRFAEWEGEQRLQRIAWVAAPSVDEAPAVFEALKDEVQGALGKPDRSQSATDEGESVGQELCLWESEDEQVQCSVIELYGERAGECEVVYERMAALSALFELED